MEHVVFFPTPDGTPAFRRFSSLDEAVRFVEHLRNAEGVEDVSVHLLTPVPVAFRAYFKVEVPPVDVAPVASVPAQPVEPMAEAALTEVPAVETVEAPVEADVLAGGKRSLGFFAH